MVLHFLGVLLHQKGQSEAALEPLTKAITRNDRIPEFHYNIAAVYLALGRLDKSAELGEAHD